MESVTVGMGVILRNEIGGLGDLGDESQHSSHELCSCLSWNFGAEDDTVAGA